MDPLNGPWAPMPPSPPARFHVVFEIADDPGAVTVAVEAESRDAVVDTATGWILAGVVPVAMPNGAVWLLPSSAIERFEVEGSGD